MVLHYTQMLVIGLSNNWMIQLAILLDYVDEKDLHQVFWNVAYEFSFGRHFFINRKNGDDKNSFFVFSGVSFFDEVTYNTT